MRVPLQSANVAYRVESSCPGLNTRVDGRNLHHLKTMENHCWLVFTGNQHSRVS